MASRASDIKIENDKIILADKYSQKSILSFHSLTGSFLLLYGYKSIKEGDVDFLNITALSLGAILLLVSLLSLFTTSFSKSLEISDINYLIDKTAFTGHRSLNLKLSNGKVRQLYLEPEDIPEVKELFEINGIEEKKEVKSIQS